MLTESDFKDCQKMEVIKKVSDWHGGSAQINGRDSDSRDRLMQIWSINFCNGAKKNEQSLDNAFQNSLLELRNGNLNLKKKMNLGLYLTSHSMINNNKNNNTQITGKCKSQYSKTLRGKH